MIRIGLRMREDVNSADASWTAVPAEADTRRAGADGLCEGCGAAWPCTACEEHSLVG
jgi:hypothetical protein